MIELINEILTKYNINVTKLVINKKSNYLNIKAKGVYNNTPSFIDFNIKITNLIYIQLNDIIINNINTFVLKNLLSIYILKNIKVLTYLKENNIKIDYIRQEIIFNKNIIKDNNINNLIDILIKYKEQ